MSSCPTKDIHSLYLDNELPLSYVKEYEVHIQSCSSCAAELEKAKKLHELLSLGGAPEMSQFEMDEGFKRLQIRMSYSKHAKRAWGASEKKPVVTAIKYAVPAMAAAAVFAVVLPVGLKSNKNDVKAGSAPALASAPVTVSAPMAAKTVSNTRTSNATGLMQQGIRSTVRPGMQVVNNVMASSENLPQVVDVFRPNFDNENTISIKITIPGTNNTVPYTTEIELPADMYKGSESEKD